MQPLAVPTINPCVRVYIPRTPFTGISPQVSPLPRLAPLRRFFFPSQFHSAENLSLTGDLSLTGPLRRRGLRWNRTSYGKSIFFPRRDPDLLVSFGCVCENCKQGFRVGGLISAEKQYLYWLGYGVNIGSSLVLIVLTFIRWLLTRKKLLIVMFV